jgi:uncharacterized membrane protein YesL
VRAFLVAGRTFISFYNELFLLIGISLFWWITGGIFVGAAMVLAYTALTLAARQDVPVLSTGNPLWLTPLFAIPSGPASAALATLVRQAARDLRADRSLFWDGFRMYWKKALVLSAIGFGVLSLLLLNLLFYLSRSQPFLQILAFLWAYLVVFWIGVLLYLFPVLIALKEPTVVGALRTAIAMTFANPIFSVFAVIIAVALTGLSIALPILLLLAWPAVIALLGEHSLKLFVERVRGPEEDTSGQNRG